MNEKRIRGFEIISKGNRKVFKEDGEVLLPLRGTKTSAGYDFFTTQDLEIKPQDKVMFWTDIKSYMPSNEMLLLDIRSSIGIKQDLMIANVLPLIDSDYHNNPSNEGNIGICLRNLKPEMKLTGFTKSLVKAYGENYNIAGYILDSEVNIPIIEDLRESNTVHIKAGERVCQGFFVEYKESDNCNSEVERTSGIGSTK
jgi:dUTP pyrophosphatase